MTASSPAWTWSWAANAFALRHNRSTHLSPGARLGPYEILAPLGAGGMGEVYRGRDTRLGRTVAIKLLPSEFVNNPQLRMRLEREGKTISQLNHPHICALYDVGHHDGLHYLVMEYLDGETLAARIAKGPLPLRDVIRYGIEIAEALHAAHRSGVIHRDLKPSNIVLTREGAKLLDFGLAKQQHLQADSQEDTATVQKDLTRTGSLVGTFRYMAPEQLESREADARSDIFALGAVLYEMTTGSPPFEGQSQATVIAAILRSDPPPIRDRQPAAPVSLERVIRKSLEKDPERRWQSAADLAEALRWVGEDFTGKTVAPRRPSRRALLTWMLAAAIVVPLGILSLRRTGSAIIPKGPPVIVLMDSPLPDRTYSSDTRATGGTNADDLTGLLRDLPVTLIKENTNALWNREDQVVRERPSLVLIHRSAFATPRGLIPDEKQFEYVHSLAYHKLQAFVGYVGVASPRTKFVIYSRGWSSVGGAEPWVRELENRFPQLRGRVKTVLVTGQPEPSFRDKASGQRMRKLVMELLGLSASG